MLEHATIEGNLLSILIYLVLFLYSVYVLLNYKARHCETVSVFQHLLVVFFCVFAFWDSDYYHYKEILSYINPDYGYTNQTTHLESLYIWLYDISGRSYLIFRLFVWGAAYLLFIYLSKKVDAYNRLTFSLFTILYCVTFSYARVSLGMVSLYLGVILLLYNNKRFINAIIGVGVLILCYFSHKSMLVPLCLIPLYFVRYKRSFMIMIIVIVFLIALFYSQNIISVLVNGPDSIEHFEMLSDTFKSASTYGEEGISLKFGMGAILLRFTQYLSLIMPLIYMSNRKIYKFIQDNIRCRVLFNGAFIIISFALSLGVIISFNSPLCYRYLYMSYVPIVLLLSNLYSQNYLTKKKITTIIIIAGISVWYRLMYSFYLTTLGV